MPVSPIRAEALVSTARNCGYSKCCLVGSNPFTTLGIITTSTSFSQVSVTPWPLKSTHMLLLAKNKIRKSSALLPLIKAGLFFLDGITRLLGSTRAVHKNDYSFSLPPARHKAKAADKAFCNHSSSAKGSSGKQKAMPVKQLLFHTVLLQ